MVAYYYLLSNSVSNKYIIAGDVIAKKHLCAGYTSNLNSEKKQERMYYGSGTGVRCCICAGQTLREHSPDSITFLHK